MTALVHDHIWRANPDDVLMCADPRCDAVHDEDERLFTAMRRDAADIVSLADQAAELLRCAGSLMEELGESGPYAEFYCHCTDDEDAAHHLADARRALRAFTRIARERTVRTEQNP